MNKKQSWLAKTILKVIWKQSDKESAKPKPEATEESKAAVTRIDKRDDKRKT